MIRKPRTTVTALAVISHLNGQDTSAFHPQIQSKGHDRGKSRKAKETSFINGHTLIAPTIFKKYRLIVFGTVTL